MKRLALATLALAPLALAAPAAEAAIVSGTYTASIGFASASFTVTFDNAASFFETTSGLSAFAIPTTLNSGTIAYAYDAALDRILFGGTEGGIGGLVTFGDVIVTIDGATSGAPSLFNFFYTVGIFTNGATFGDVSFTPAVAAAVPEPAALALLGLGLFGLAAIRRTAA